MLERGSEGLTVGGEGRRKKEEKKVEKRRRKDKDHFEGLCC